VWAIRKKKNDLLFGWVFFTVNVMFLLQIVGAGQGFLADRFTYIAYIGLFFILIKGYEWMTVNRPKYTLFLQIGSGVYLAIFAFLTFRQVKVWENSETLWEYVKVYFPNSPLAWKQAGNYYRDEKKDFSKALLNYNEAVRLEPKDAYVYNSVAKIYMDKAFSLDPQKNDYANEKQSLVRLAIQNYDQSINRDSINGMPDKKQAGETIVNRGVAYAVLGDMQRALQDLGRGLDINPNNTNGYLNRGLIYFNMNEWELSLKDHDKYIALDPYNPDMFHERALCYIGLEQPAKALPDFDRAIFLKGDQPLYYIWRSKALRMIGKTDAAIKDAQRARELGGQVPDDMLQ
jgi:tetratricopeptide (TPR) repeat protein